MIRKLLEVDGYTRLNITRMEVFERFKATLVIFGNHQVEGIEYNEKNAPVAKLVTV